LQCHGDQQYAKFCNRFSAKEEEEDILTAQTLESQGTSLEATILQPYKLTH
jgi:hypothetical protein